MTNNTKKETDWRSLSSSSSVPFLFSSSLSPSPSIPFSIIHTRDSTHGRRKPPDILSTDTTTGLSGLFFPILPHIPLFPSVLISCHSDQHKAAGDKQREPVTYLSVNQDSDLCIFQSALNGAQIKPQFYICFTSAIVSAALFRFIAAAPDLFKLLMLAQRRSSRVTMCHSCTRQLPQWLAPVYPPHPFPCQQISGALLSSSPWRPH